MKGDLPKAELIKILYCYDVSQRMDGEMLQVKGGSIHYWKIGNGLPIVLIHAGYLDSRMWDNQVEHFSGEYTVITYDVRGFGKSSAAMDRYTDADDLELLLDHLKVEKSVLIGVSNGGRISFDFAVEHPDRVMAMVLVDPGIKGYRSSGPEEDALWDDFNLKSEEQNALIREGKFREAAVMDVEIWTPMLTGDMREKITNIALENARVYSPGSDPFELQVSPEPPAFTRLDALKMPILMVVGDHDLPGMIVLARRVHEMIPHSRMITIKGADHVPSLSRPEEFTRIVQDFLKNVK